LSLQDIINSKVPYLDAFIEEVLRMSSPIAVVSKEALRDMPILGHLVPKGTLIMLTTRGPTINYRGAPVDEATRSESSKKHVSDGLGDWAECEYPADRFHPERWLKSVENTQHGEVTHDSKAGPFLSFSTGTRGCWGRRLAYLELRLITTLLVWNFAFEPLPQELHDWDAVDELFTKPKHSRVILKSAWAM
jgi:cytochrome P450